MEVQRINSQPGRKLVGERMNRLRHGCSWVYSLSEAEAGDETRDAAISCHLKQVSGVHSLGRAHRCPYRLDENRSRRFGRSAHSDLATAQRNADVRLSVAQELE